MSTPQFLGRLERLQRCEDDPGSSDMTEPEIAKAGGILFKSDPAWKTAYDDLKNVLSTREHVPGPQERKAARRARAKRNRNSARQPGRKRAARRGR